MNRLIMALARLYARMRVQSLTRARWKKESDRPTRQCSRRLTAAPDFDVRGREMNKLKLFATIAYE